MNERDVEYVAAFINEQIRPRYVGKLSQLGVKKKPTPGPHGPECRVLLAVDGGETAKKVLQEFCSGLGMLGQLNFPEGRGNIWLGKCLAPAGLLGMAVNRGAPWLLSISSTQVVALPSNSPQYTPFHFGLEEGQVATGGYSDPSALVDFEERQAQLQDKFPEAPQQLKSFVAAVSRVAMESPAVQDISIAPLMQFEDGGEVPSPMVVVHGFKTTLRASQLIKAVIANVGQANA